LSKGHWSEIHRISRDEVVIKSHPLPAVGLATEVTHEAAAHLTVAESGDIICAEITFGRGAGLNVLEVLNVHISREAFYSR
jgi:hypothetical protein